MDASLDNLRLLAAYCSSSSPLPQRTTAQHEKTVDAYKVTTSEALSATSNALPIATPVPLPYSARGRHVLYNMISGSKEDIDYPITWAEQLEKRQRELEYAQRNHFHHNAGMSHNVTTRISAAPASTNTDSHFTAHVGRSESHLLRSIGYPSTWAEQLEQRQKDLEYAQKHYFYHNASMSHDVTTHISAAQGSTNPNSHFTAHIGRPERHVFRPIRPVSPATLIALTEPFLMAWCTNGLLQDPLPGISAPASAYFHSNPHSLFSIVPLNHLNPTSHSVGVGDFCNAWRY